MDSVIEKTSGQDVIDSLSVLDAVVPTFHEDTWSQFHELFPMIGLALRSRFAIIRQCAAKCFATICNSMTVAAMRYVIEQVVPYLGDSVNLHYRQGATELIYRKSLLNYDSSLLTTSAQISCKSWISKPSLMSFS